MGDRAGVARGIAAAARGAGRDTWSIDPCPRVRQCVSHGQVRHAAATRPAQMSGCISDVRGLPSSHAPRRHRGSRSVHPGRPALLRSPVEQGGDRGAARHLPVPRGTPHRGSPGRRSRAHRIPRRPGRGSRARGRDGGPVRSRPLRRCRRGVGRPLEHRRPTPGRCRPRRSDRRWRRHRHRLGVHAGGGGPRHLPAPRRANDRRPAGGKLVSPRS
jgi:hypothetical protein